MGALSKFALSLAVLIGAAGTSFAQQAGPAGPLSPGALVAVAGDCASCHATPEGGSEFSGGMAIAAPMGQIYARNITPDPETGIGNWTLEQFTAALRDGRSPTLGHLYPAMPYTSYRYMTDEDVKALFDYLMNEVEPVSNKVPETDLGFPFVRPAMIVWDALFAGSGKVPEIAGASDQVKRGQYLVNVLGHCGECHTPRGLMFQSKAGNDHLGGANVGGWYAPDISSDQSGIGQWSDDRLKSFLAHGKGRRENAGGDMGLAVRMSLSKLPESDLDAIVAYLKATPPVPGLPEAPVDETPAPVDITGVEPINTDYESFYKSDSTDGAALYVAACATCHGVDGALPDGAGPPLTQSRAVRAGNAINVVQTVAHGINLVELDQVHLMPSFRSEMTNAQIAAVASYVRQRFGGIGSAVSEAEVENILAGRVGVPWIMLNAKVLAWLGIAAAAMFLLLLFWRLRPRRA